MKVRFPKTGEVVDLATQDYLFVLIKLGLLEQAKPEAAKPKEPGVARWWAEGNDRKNASVVGFCSVCRQSVKAFKPNDKVKLEHCGHTDLISKEALGNYERLVNTW